MTETTLKDPKLGMLVQRCQLPVMQTGVDAVEARLIVVQDLPPKAELRFFTVRDDKHVQVSSEAALALLRAHFPRKAVSELTQIELLAEVAMLRDEVDRMQPVYETAKAWRAGTNAEMQQRLVAAVDAAATAATVKTKVAGLRLRVKVWTDPTTGKRYLMPQALVASDQRMIAYAMRDDATTLVKLTGDEWNALPFFYFEEDGEAPRAAARPVDVVF